MVFVPSKKSLKPSTAFPRSSGRLIDDRRRETVKVRLATSELNPIARAAKATNCTPARFLRDAGIRCANGAGHLDSDRLGQLVLIVNALFLQAQDERLRICPKLAAKLSAELRQVMKHLGRPAG
ncbi:hypothetical protein KTN05_16760 [Paracoccus sp. Z118]|uniref:hypothetical protein n=1 Tax=Paracoccus sp. Z118 TaxID=2851017 RepID=UPI001C2C6D2D|nr:hypothetical protein [Paracoccus sp. Z118]MBV0893454.1 hypothetical protein [Paracoccus sp. Z118]